LLKYLENNKTVLVYWPLGIYWAILLVLTSLPGNDLPDIKISDKIEHLLAFFGLAILLRIALTVQDKYQKLKEYSASFTLIIVGVYAALDELHQLFIPGRDCEFLDWVADFTGAAFGVLIIGIILKYLSTKQIDSGKLSA
jgi:VanZ family protein